MNPPVSPEKFVEQFKDSALTICGRGAQLAKHTVVAMSVLATLAMTGCSVTPDLQKNATLEMNQAVATNALKTITVDNALEIIKNQQSGVYQNPLSPDEITTISFLGDPHAEETLKKDFKALGKHGDDHRIMSMVSSLTDATGYHDNQRSHHVQNPFFADNINYVIMNPDDMYGAQNPREGVEQAVDVAHFQEYFAYHTLVHEITHGALYQQMSGFDLATSLFDKKQLTMMENGAEATAAIATIQLMHAKNETPETIAHYLQIEVGHSQSQLAAYKIKKGVETHAAGGALAFVDAVYQQQPEVLLNLSAPEIVDFAEIIATSAVDLDYAPAVKQQIESNMQDVIGQMTKMLDRSYDNAHRDPQGYTASLKLMERQLEHEKVSPPLALLYGELLDLGMDIQEAAPDTFKDMSADLLYQALSNGQEEVFLYSHEGQKTLSAVKLTEIPQLNDVIQERLGEAGYQVSLAVETPNMPYAEKMTPSPDLAQLDAEKISQENERTSRQFR
jgi:hypothetical protein